ncbi:MAG: glucose-6-phosphate isomerase [Bacteroidales bacterium]|nr:glucose-6-phosphate isomerase [Bacteroidales bacterium]
MLTLNLKGCDTFVKNAEYQQYVQKALAAYDTLDKEDGAGNDFLGWKHLPSETLAGPILAQCKDIQECWKAKGVDLVLVLGIGGSYLGAKCAIEALNHTFDAILRNNGAPQVVFGGQNLGEDYLCEMMDLMNVRNVACICISKSGTTTETAVAFRIVKQYIEKKYGKKEASERIVAVTDKARGALKSLSTQEGYKTFVIPDNVGGRFSVLTPVGVLPILIAGFDVEAILKGALDMEQKMAVKSEENIAVQYAAMRNLLYSEYGKKIEILINFVPKLTYFAEWWKQLYGESEGKDQKGIFPAACSFTTDLHSMGQFIQEGDRVMFETLVSVQKPQRSLVIEADEQNLDGLNFLAGKSVDYCNHMAQLGTKLAHIDGGVPQLEVEIEKLDEFNLGQLFYFFEFACGVSAYTLGVNPFNQPGVEAYKKNMFALLEKPGYEEATKEIRKRI